MPPFNRWACISPTFIPILGQNRSKLTDAEDECGSFEPSSRLSYPPATDLGKTNEALRQVF